MNKSLKNETVLYIMSLSNFRASVGFTIIAIVAGYGSAQADTTMLIDAIRQNGCVASSFDVFDRMFASFMPDADTAEKQQIVDALLDGEATWSEFLISSETASQAVLHPRHCGENGHLFGHQKEGDRLLSMIRENGCRMDEATAEGVLPAAGFEQLEVGLAVQSWINKGIAHIDDGSIVLEDSVC